MNGGTEHGSEGTLPGDDSHDNLRFASAIMGHPISWSGFLEAGSAFDLGVLEEDVGVGHAGDVVGYYAGEAFGEDLFGVAFGELVGVLDPEVEEAGDDFFSFRMLEVELRAGVEGFVEIALFLLAVGFDERREGGDAVRGRREPRRAW